MIEGQMEVVSLNIANWGNPGLVLGGANYGKITGRAGEQRRLQFAVKYIF